MPRPSLLAVATLALALVGCGGGGGGGKPATKSVTLDAPVDRIQPGATLAFTAFVQGGGKVVWSVDGGAANGAITQSGVYTAPATQGTYTVRATVGGKSASKTVTVFNGISIALTTNAAPPLAIPLSKLTFAATVSGSTNRGVTWSGTGVAADGTFTAPAVGTYAVTATSQADPTKTATATVQVVANVNLRFKWQGKDDLLLNLRLDVAPNTSANLVTLVNKGFYDGIALHRTTSVAADGFDIIQWGDPLTKTLPLSDPSIGTGGPGYQIPFETTNLPNAQYTLAMARSASRDSGGSQLYVNRSDNRGSFDPGGVPNYVVFGTVDPSSTSAANALARGDKIVSARTEALP